MSELLGTRMAVDYSLLKELRLRLERKGADLLLEVSGTIMESAKVFHSVGVKPAEDRLLLTVYASMVFWNKQGSPDFQTAVKLALAPGEYHVWYESPRTQPAFLGTWNV